MKNELPLMRPMIPPARPKKSMMTSRPFSAATAGASGQCVDRPEDRGYGGDADHDPEAAHSQPDHDLEGEGRDHDEHGASERAPHDRGLRLSRLEISSHEKQRGARPPCACKGFGEDNRRT